MKTFSPPSSVRIPSFNEYFVGGRFDRQKMVEVEDRFKAELAAELRAMGYTKPLTGKIVSFPIADGAAQYMVAEGPTTCLIHLQLGDAWSIPEAHARGLRKSDIVAMLDRDGRIAELFAKKA